jgi:soluble lytic murein transglycosylase-like protein
MALFVFANVTGFLFSPAFAPTVNARDLGTATATDADVIPSDVPSSGDQDLDWLIFRAGEKYGIDPRFIHAVIWQESKYKPSARSHAGAQGLMQLMPDTAKRFGCNNSNDPAENIEAGTRYLRWLLERFDGNISLALAGYNAGEGSVDKYDGVPPYSETQNYVRIITERYGKAFHPILAPAQALVEFRLIPQIITLDTSSN